MKVNINGSGLIPNIGLIPPVYNKDLDKSIVKKIIGCPTFQVYVAATGIRITNENIDEVFSGPVVPKPVSVEVLEPVETIEDISREVNPLSDPDVKESVVEETPVVETVEETTDDATYEELPEITEDPETEEKENVPVEETKDETPRQNNYNGKKNKHKRH